MDGTDPGLYLMVGFDIISVEPCKDVSWKELHWSVLNTNLF
jgi:hypothetical protein